MASAAPLAGSFPQQREFRIDGADADASARGPRTVDARRQQRRTSRPSARRSRRAARSSRPTRQTSPPVVILSESMARYYFKNENPIGRRISWKLINGELVVDAAGGDRRRRRRLARRRHRPDADAHDVSARHAGVRAVDAARAHGRHDRPPRAARRRNDSHSSIRTGRSITCRRSRRSATRRSRRSG